MKRSFSLVALAASAALLTAGFLTACMSDDDDPIEPGKGGSAGAAGTTNQGGSAGGSAEGGAAGQAGGTSQGGGGSGGGASVCMEGKATTVKDIATGVVGADQAVKFSAVATTPAMLVYSSKSSGSCLWGVFVKDPAADYGTMIVSYGDKATTDADGGAGACPDVSTSGLLDGVVPGDVLEITAKTDAYAPSSCTGAAPQVQIVIFQDQKSCAMTKTGSGAAPAPVKVTDLAGIKAGKGDFQGLLVEINDVTAEDWPDAGAVGPYGKIKLSGSGLEIHDSFYYKAKGAPQFCSAQHFNKITGIVHLDYCDWVIQPLDPTTDFDPPSPQCAQ